MRESICYKRKLRPAMILIMSMAVLLLAGCGNKNIQKDNSSQENQGSQAGNSNQQSPASSANQPKIGTEEAKEAALKHAGLTASEVTFIKEELDYEDGKTEYDIEFVTSASRYEYEISAEDGAVLESSQEPVEQVPENLLGQGVISVEQAKEAALNHAGFTPEQAAYIKVELEQDDGALQYEIEFYAEGKEYSSTINANTGAVMKYEME